VPAGTYSVRASLAAGGRRFAANGTVRLVGSGQVVTRRARMLSFPAPKAHRGQAAPVEAMFRNTGNVTYSPRALVQIRPAGAAGTGRVSHVVTATAQAVPPGRTGRIRASFPVRSDSGPLEVTVQLLDGARKLDERTASVTPTDPPAFTDRVSEFVSEHAIRMVAGLVLLLALAVGAGVAYVRRLRRALHSAQARTLVRSK
jgi:hypothetical protein